MSALIVGWAWRESAASEKTGKGWLGVSVEELTPSLRKKLKLGEQTGLRVTHVVPNSPADDAGFREDDVIVEFDGKKVEEANEFTRLVRNAGADKKVAVVLVREGERKNMEVILGKRRSPGQAYAYAFGDAPHAFALSNRPRLGVQVHELNESLAAYFKVQPREGVLILEVNEDSPAENAGLKSGDVITKVGEEKIRDAEDLIEALAEYEEGDKVAVAYVRQGKSATVEIEMEEGRTRTRFWSPRHEGMGLHELQWHEGEEPEATIRKIEPRIHRLEDMIRNEVDADVRREIEVNVRRALDEARLRREWSL
jgi:serine protease Do